MDSRYDQIYFIPEQVFSTILIVEFYSKPVAIICNILIAIIFSTKQLRKHSMSFYICLQAVLDSIYLTIEFVYYFLLRSDDKDTSLWASSFCWWYLYYIMDIFQFMHVYLVVLTTADRLLFIIYPARFNIIRNIWFQSIIGGSLFATAVGIYIPILDYLRNAEYPYNSFMNCISLVVINSEAYNWMNLSLLCLVPSVIMLITSIKLIMIIKQSKKKFKQKSAKDGNNKSTTKFAGNILAADLFFLGSTILKYAGILTLDIVATVADDPANENDLPFYFAYMDYFKLLLFLTTAISSVGLYTSPFFVHLFTNKVFNKIFVGFFVRTFKCTKQIHSNNNIMNQKPLTTDTKLTTENGI